MNNLKYVVGYATALAPYTLAAWLLLPAPLATLWLIASAVATLITYATLDCLYAGSGAELRVAFYAFVVASLHFAAVLLASWAPLIGTQADEITAAVGSVLMGAFATVAPSASIVAVALGAPRVAAGSLLMHLLATYYLRLLS